MAANELSYHANYADEHDVDENTLVRDTQWGKATYQATVVGEEYVHFDNGEKVGHADLVAALENHLEIVGMRATI